MNVLASQRSRVRRRQPAVEMQGCVALQGVIIGDRPNTDQRGRERRSWRTQSLPRSPSAPDVASKLG
jgi:hypothetical protein